MTGRAAEGDGVDAGESVGATLSEPELRDWGVRLGRAACAERAFVALIGPLGAGKTTLIRAACEGCGVEEPVTSPTFTLVHRYRAPSGFVYHADLYRIGSPAELPGIGWEELTEGEAPVFVEWAERAGDELPEARWEVRLSFAEGGHARLVEARSEGGAPRVPDPRASEGEGASEVASSESPAGRGAS